MKTYVINMDRSPERWEAMVKAFPDDDLIRVEGVDGWEYSDGTFNRKSSPNWKDAERVNYVNQGVLHPGSRLSPAAVGCNLGHRRALETFLQTKDEWAMILEDDVEPTGDRPLSTTNVPRGCDMLYLCGADHPGDRVRLTKDGEIYLSRTLMGYAINRRAARLGLAAMFPMVYLFDFQISVCCFASLTNLNEKWNRIGGVPIMKKRFVARGIKKGGYIRHSEHAKKTTFTENGRHDWIDAHRDIR